MSYGNSNYGQDPYPQSSTPDPNGPQSNYAQPAYDPAYAPQGGYGSVQPYAGGYTIGYDAAHPPRPSVGFVDAIKLFFKNYANFYGRASRSEFWWAYLALIIALLIPYVIGLALTMAAATAGDFSPIGTTFLVLMAIIALGCIIPELAMMVRRLHDTGRSGWFYFISLVPFVGGIILLVFLAGESKPEGVRFDNPDGSQPATA